MKKALAALLALCLAASLFGCRKQPETEDHSTDAADEPNVSTNVTIVQKPMVSVSLPTVTETQTAQDGTPVFHYVYPNMSLVLPDAEIADKVIIDHLTRLDTHHSALEGISESAINNYAPGESFVPYLYSINYSPMRIDQGVLSILGTNVTYMGGAHPDQHCFAANYDLTTGEVLTLGSILHHIDAKKTLEDLVIQQLDAVAEKYYLDSGYAEYVRQRFARDESYDEDWYFSGDGLCFFFSPYEIAPYSSGTIIAEIPYASLVGVIADAFFPAERVSSAGTLSEVAFGDADLTKFTQISELVLEQENDKTLYFTDSIVHDVRVFQTNPVTGYRTTVFATQALTPGDALMIEASADVRNALTISYVSGDQTVMIQH